MGAKRWLLVRTLGEIGIMGLGGSTKKKERCPDGSKDGDVFDMRYAIVIEKANGNYSAYVPDLPGCVATGESAEEVEREIRKAIRFHLDGLRQDGVPIPEPSSICEYVEA